MSDSLLVTGGCGFIGANLVPRLLEEGARVRVLDNMSRGSVANLEGVEVEVMEGDIRDEGMVARALVGVDAVIHLAAYGSVVESVADPVENFEVNVRGTLTLLQASAKAGVEKLIFASTGGALIGEAEPPVNEDSLPKPISPYGASKLCAEAYCHAFSQSYGLHAVCLRFANVYGPRGAHKGGAVTAFINALKTGEPMVVYGDGSASRDFLYVDDLCSGIVRALEGNPAPGSVLHLASGAETTIDELARTLAEIAGQPAHPIRYEPPRKGEVGRNFASFERARKTLGFSPRVSLREGLERTWRWFTQQEPSVLVAEASNV
jgi:UDP-glucose 4-epimerase